MMEHDKLSCAFCAFLRPTSECRRILHMYSYLRDTTLVVAPSRPSYSIDYYRAWGRDALVAGALEDIDARMGPGAGTRRGHRVSSGASTYCA